MVMGTQKDFEEQHNMGRLLKTKFFDGYKNRFRQVKEYR